MGLPGGSRRDLNFYENRDIMKIDKMTETFLKRGGNSYRRKGVRGAGGAQRSAKKVPRPAGQVRRIWGLATRLEHTRIKGKQRRK